MMIFLTADMTQKANQIYIFFNYLSLSLKISRIWNMWVQLRIKPYSYIWVQIFNNDEHSKQTNEELLNETLCQQKAHINIMKNNVEL